MSKTPIFNIGNPAHAQCAQRDDGMWFARIRRHDAPGFTAWKIASFITRPPYSWYDGHHARLPKCNDSKQSVHESGVYD
jgi:hypothetical protein